MRNKSGLNLLHPVWSLFLEDGGRFLLAAKVGQCSLLLALSLVERSVSVQKRMGKKTSNYLIAMQTKPTDRKSAALVGKLRSNWVRYPSPTTPLASSCVCLCI